MTRLGRALRAGLRRALQQWRRSIRLRVVGSTVALTSLAIGLTGWALLAQVADGLAEAGNNLYVETPNSGAISIGEGGNLGRGSVVSGSLENSNVDTAEQFVRLIEAQRGFQANARVISTVDEVLAEVVNLI